MKNHISLFLSMNIKNITFIYSYRNRKILFFKIIINFFIIYTFFLYILRMVVIDIRNIHLNNLKDFQLRKFSL